MYAIFNLKKEFLSFSESEMGSNFLSKKIPEEKSNLLEWKWVGDFDSGEMKKINIKKIRNNDDTFQNKYEYGVFMSLILKQLYINSKKTKTLNENFENMVRDFICYYEKPEIYLELLRYTNKL
jgi:hypothetical protein